MTAPDMLAENRRRIAALRHSYDPATGCGCTGTRVRTVTPDGVIFAPESLLADRMWHAGLSGVALDRLRCHHDFEFWAWRCVRIPHRLTGDEVRFVANAPQRRLLAVLERQRAAGRPIRVILLKSRGWGASTLIQLYMAWIQIVHRRNWHSLTCAHMRDSAADIRGTSSKLLDGYPPEMWEEDMPLRLAPVSQSRNTRVMAARGCRMTACAADRPDAARIGGLAMAHLSEVAFWKSSKNRSPAATFQSILGSIPLAPCTLVVMESTANGAGSFFHQEWLRAVKGESAFEPVFVAWHESEYCRLGLTDSEASVIADSLTPAEIVMWRDGNTLGQIAWHRARLGEMGCTRRMAAEFPSSPDEAFAADGTGVFPSAAVERMRVSCRKPDEENDDGLAVWVPPERGAEYVVAVDVGGRADTSDYSVIAALKASGSVPEVCAQWRGHIGYGLLADKAAAIAARYNNALLVVESNTPECRPDMPGGPGALLGRLAGSYHNLYRRDIRSGDISETRPGFHINRETKSAVIANMQRMVRDGTYVERDSAALSEMHTYERTPDGSWGARRGCHDDILMSRAIALYVIMVRRLSPAASAA